MSYVSDKSWKGAAPFNNPTGVAVGHIRPLTNKDYSNNVEYKHGLPRPIRHYRTGVFTANTFSENPSYDNRNVRSSARNIGMVGAMQDRPGGFTINTNVNGDVCDSGCHGTGVVSSWQPTTNITIKPQAVNTSGGLCCNAQKSALARVRGSLPKKNNPPYYNQGEYLQARCKTYDQRVFNFIKGDGAYEEELYVAQCGQNCMAEYKWVVFVNTMVEEMLNQNWITEEQAIDLSASTTPAEFTSKIEGSTMDELSWKEGELDALAKLILLDLGMENLLSRPAQSCSRVYYKPNNKPFSVQGGVSGSAQILRKKVNSIEKTAYQTSIADKHAVNLYKIKTQPPVCKKKGLCF